MTRVFSFCERINFFILISTPLIMIFFRNIPTVILAFLGIFIIVYLLLNGNKLQYMQVIINKKHILIIFLLFLFMLLSLLWSPIPERGAVSLLHMIATVFVFLIAFLGVSLFTYKNPSTSMVPCLILLLAALLILFEMRFGSPVRSFFGGNPVSHRLNRGVVATVLFLPLALYALPRTRIAIMIGCIVSYSVAIAAFSSASESAKLALLILIFSIPLFYLGQKKLLYVFNIVCISSLIFMPIIAVYIHSLIPEFLSNRPYFGTIKIRADMWAEFSELIWLRPLLGQGMEASYVAQDIYGHLVTNAHVLGFGHTHNFAMQVWYELGFVGVLLISWLISLFIRSLKSLPTSATPWILSTVSAFWAVSLVSHGAWQAWWWSLMGIVTLLWIVFLRIDVSTQ